MSPNRLTFVEGPIAVMNPCLSEIGIPETLRRDETVVDDSVLRFVAIGEAGAAAKDAEKNERDRRKNNLRVAAFAVVGGQRCQDLEDQEGARGEHVGELRQHVRRHLRRAHR